jgi:signal transduction histidine kinase
MNFLQNIGLKFTDPHVESEYRETKERKSNLFFKGVWLVILIAVFLRLFLKINCSYIDKWLYITMVTALLALFLFRKWLKIWFMVITMIIGCLNVVVFMRFSGDVSIFDTDIVYLFGFNAGLLYRLIQAQMSSIWMILLVETVFTIPKLLILSGIPTEFILIHSFYLFMGIIFLLGEHHENRNFFNKIVHKRNNLQKFQELLNTHLPQGILVFDRQLEKIIFQNKSCENILREPKISHMANFLCYLPKVSSFRKKGSETIGEARLNLLCLLKETKGRFENSYCNFEGEDRSKKVFLAEAFPFVWDNEEAIILILNDITNQEHFITLRETDTNKDRALSTISHELRTPISGILGILGIMEQKKNDLENYDLIQICKSSAILLMNLVNSILDLQQIRSGKFKINKEIINIRELANSLIPLFKVQSAQKGIGLELEIETNVDEKILTDRSRLIQVLINLIGNAVKFTFAGCVKIRIKKETDKIWFSVEDTGVGISEDQIEDLFKIYGKLEDPKRINTQGVGLGLTISNNLVSLLNDDDPNCKILVESTPNKGTTFCFHLQKNTQLETEELVTENDVQWIDIPGFDSISHEPTPRKVLINPSPLSFLPKISSFQTMTISTEFESPRVRQKISEVLVVDDNSVNVIIAKKMIERTGLKVICAYHGKEAIDVVMRRRNEIKLIVMDCQMPIMDGYEALAILKRKMSRYELPKIPIYLLSAKNYESIVQELRGKAEMDGYIMKPLTNEELEIVLKKHDLL